MRVRSALHKRLIVAAGGSLEGEGDAEVSVLRGILVDGSRRTCDQYAPGGCALRLRVVLTSRKGCC